MSPSVFAPSPHGLSAAALSLWAKTHREDPALRLSLAQHMADSAGVAWHLWDGWASAQLRNRIAELTDFSGDEARTIVSWLAAVHDIGKATFSFQTQLEQRHDLERGHFVERLRDAGLPLRMSNLERSLKAFPHSVASREILKGWLEKEGVRPRVASSWAGIVDAHHGISSDSALRNYAADVLQSYPVEWIRVHHELLGHFARETGVEPLLPRMQSSLNADAQQLFTGLVIIADWIASNQDFFPLEEHGDPVERLEAGLAVDLTSPWRAEPLAKGGATARLQHRFAWPHTWSARPIQEAVADAVLHEECPGLVLIEAPTGEGKTEAALLGAEILAARTGAGGILVAAPTMATADGLFQRVSSWAQRATPEGNVTSMFLGHSKAHLNKDAQKLRNHGSPSTPDPDPEEFNAPSFGSIDIDAAGDTAGIPQHSSGGEVIASQWMSGRKKGILSNFTVATVDQVLLMALQARHSMLRHIGIANKVVVIDEVHAYDAYMSEYLATALAWLARYRVPVLLLSATLPHSLKKQLVSAYHGEFSRVDYEPSLSSYPSVTTVAPAGVREFAVPARKSDLHAHVSLLPDNENSLRDLLEHTLADGGCALVICNTVRRAQEAFAIAQSAWPGDVELLHAGFIATDRAKKESVLRDQLGPDSHRGAGRPFRKVIVATQVAEQSLDIDADLLVTDLAPMDLLIQRIGRLHRHPRPCEDRPDNLRSGHVYIRGVLSLEDGQIDRAAAAVYDERALLSTLALVISDLVPNGFTRPDDVPSLVQAAYSPTPPVIPTQWSEQWTQAVAESERARRDARSKASTFRFPEPSKASSIERLFEIQTSNIDTVGGELQGLAQVRDSDPSVEVIPILTSPGGYRPLGNPSAAQVDYPESEAPNPKLAYLLANSTVRLPSRLTRFASQFEAVLSQLESETPIGWKESPWLRGLVALRIDAETGKAQVNGSFLAYDSILGLQDLGRSQIPTPASMEGGRIE